MLSALIWLPLVALSATASKPSFDYLLQVQTTGYENVIITGNKKPKEIILRQIEIRIRPNVPFQSTTIIGDRELILKGKLTDGKKEEFRIQIYYSHNRLTNLSILEGKRTVNRTVNIAVTVFSC